MPGPGMSGIRWKLGVVTPKDRLPETSHLMTERSSPSV
jgi:hypothetical protein